MKQALDFIRTHLVSLLCALVAVGAIVVCVLGMTSDSIVVKMEEERNRIGATSIGGLRSKPQNEQPSRLNGSAANCSRRNTGRRSRPRRRSTNARC